MSWPTRRPVVPASCNGLEGAAIENALIDTRGNVTAAATLLHVKSANLRKFVWSRPKLADVIFEQIERMVDEAERVLREGLESDNFNQRFRAAKLIVTHSEAGRRRGWGRGRALRDEAQAQPVTLRWLDGPEPN